MKFPVRYILCLVCTLTSFTAYLSRSNLSIAIVSMTEKPKTDNTSSQNILCPDLLHDSVSEEEGGVKGETFDWSPELQGSALGCFYWTYLLFQLPSGYIASRFGARWPITISFILTAILSGLGPIFAHVSPYLFIASRAAMAVTQASIFPGIFVLIMTWMPLYERSMGMAMGEIGIHIGNITLYFTSGFLIRKFTWTSMFYFPAIASVVALIVTTILLRNSPEDHYLMTHEELAYIRKKTIVNKGKDCEMRSSNGSDSMESSSESIEEPVTEHFAVPWKKMMTNKVVITLLFFKFSRYLTITTVTANMPGYFKNVLNESIVSVGINYAIFTGILFVSTLTSAKTSEIMIAKGWFTRTNCRKFFSIFSGLISSIAFMMIPVMRCNIIAAKFFFYLYAVCIGSLIATDALIPAEITTNFSAILFSIGNMSTIVPAFIGPFVVGSVLGKYGVEWIAWDIIMHSFGAIGIVTSIVFLLFISAEKQDFDDVREIMPRDSRSMSVVSAMSCSHPNAL
jgi:sugar phosphate permease